MKIDRATFYKYYVDNKRYYINQYRAHEITTSNLRNTHK